MVLFERPRSGTTESAVVEGAASITAAGVVVDDDLLGAGRCDAEDAYSCTAATLVLPLVAVVAPLGCLSCWTAAAPPGSRAEEGVSTFLVDAIII